MGKRGPGAGRMAKAAKRPGNNKVNHPWTKKGMPADEQVLAFLRSLPIVSGLKAGEKMELADFQERFVRGVYGKHDEEGRRLVRLAVLSVARGNGKSALLAGLSLAHLLGPMAEPYGECYAAALDREQSGVLYRMVRAYIEETPWMAARCNVRDWHKSIEVEDTRSKWTALTSDARKAHGLAPSFWIADEVAQWRKRDLWDNLATGMGKRRDALGVTISTQAADDIHFLSEMIDAEEDPSTYVQLHAAPEDCKLDDEAAWEAANPALGLFRDRRELEIAADRAIRSPSFATAFRLLYLNQRVDADERFIDAADWEANGEPFDPDELEGQACYGGLDLSSTRDLTALSLWFPESGKALTWHFVPRDTIAERCERDRVPYDRWESDGWIETTNGRATDRQTIARRLADIRQLYDVKAIAFDRWRFEDLAKLLDDEGIDLPMVEFVPGFKTYGLAVDAFERALLERRMQHNGSPILKWQAGNVIVETDAAGNRKPSKGKSFEKIDGLVTLIMAAGIADKEAGREADYDGDGPIWL